MNVFDDLRGRYRDRLTAAGLPATTDPAANVPMVLVDIPDITAVEGKGALTCVLPVRIVVPAPGDATAATALLDALETVLETIPSPTLAQADTYGPGELPAYTVTYTVTVPHPRC